MTGLLHICVAKHVCAMTRSHVAHNSCIRVTRIIQTRAITHPYLFHDSFTRVTGITPRPSETIHGEGQTGNAYLHIFCVCVFGVRGYVNLSCTHNILVLRVLY